MSEVDVESKLNDDAELNDDDVDALMEKLMHEADTQPDLDLSWLKMTTKEKHDAEYDRLTKKKKEHDEKLRRLTQEANQMLAKYKEEEEENPNKEPDISDEEFKDMIAEYEGGKTRRHKRKQNGYSKKRTYRKKSTNKNKRTYKKKSMNKKKRTHKKRA